MKTDTLPGSRTKLYAWYVVTVLILCQTLGAMDSGSSRSLSWGRPKAGTEGFGRDDPAV